MSRFQIKQSLLRQKIVTFLSSGPKVAIALLLLIILWLALGLIANRSSDEDLNSNSKPSKQAAKELNQVEIKVLPAEDISTEITLLGETQYSRRLVIRALSEGVVTTVSDKEGQVLNKGDLIVKIDDREVRARLEHSKALLNQKEIAFEAHNKLFDQELISNSELAEARAEYEHAKAQKLQQELQLASTYVTMPFTGVLQKVLTEERDYASRGKDLAEVLDFSPTLVLGTVPEKEALLLDIGQKARISLYNDQSFEATLSYKSLSADQSTRSFSIELEINNPKQDSIPSGVSANIHLPILHQGAHNIPMSILEIDENGRFRVKALNEENQVIHIPVDMIKSDNKQAWVSGLPDQVRLIVQGSGFVSLGEQVEPIVQPNEQNNVQNNIQAITTN